MAVLEREAELALVTIKFFDSGTGTLGSSRYLFHMWYPSFIKMRVKHDL